MAMKLTLKFGQVEVQYEGDETFLKEHLLGIVKSISELAKQQPHAPHPASGGSGTPNHKLSTSIVAGKLKVKTGPALIMAAAIHLTLSGNDTISRDDLLAEMRTAKTYYKATYNNNLSKYLKSLVTSGKLIESATDVYAIPEAAIEEMKIKLA